MAYAIDPIYNDPNVEYANDLPIGGMGYEPAQNRPGFIYKGPVEGEAAARNQFNAEIPTEAWPQPDYSGNVAAQQHALQFERVKSQYDAQREIENAYAQAKNQQEMAAARSAEEFARQQNTQRAIEGGMTPYEALATYGIGGRGGNVTAGAINALKPATITSQTLPDGTVVVSNGKTFKLIDAPPVDIQTKDGTIKGQLIDDPNTGQPDPHRYAVINPRTGKYDIINTQEKSLPEVTAKVTLAGPNPNIPGITLSGPASRMKDYGVTNFAKSNPSSPAPTIVTSKAQFDKLQSGDVYIGKDGKKYRKP